VSGGTSGLSLMDAFGRRTQLSHSMASTHFRDNAVHVFSGSAVEVHEAVRVARQRFTEGCWLDLAPDRRESFVSVSNIGAVNVISETEQNPSACYLLRRPKINFTDHR